MQLTNIHERNESILSVSNNPDGRVSLLGHPVNRIRTNAMYINYTMEITPRKEKINVTRAK